MTRQEAKDQLLKAYDDVENARITRAAFVTVVEETVDQLAREKFHAGMLWESDGGDTLEEDT